MIRLKLACVAMGLCFGASVFLYCYAAAKASHAEVTALIADCP